MTNEDKLHRNLCIWHDRKMGSATYKELSFMYGVSRERCRQIYLKMERRFTHFLEWKYLPKSIMENTYFMYVKAEIDEGRLKDNGR